MMFLVDYLSNKTDKLDLDDKSDVKAYHYTNEQYEYEDEYDDTYDSNINAPDNDETAFIVKYLNHIPLSCI